METQFIGEHLLPGKIGQFFVVLSFCSALLAALSYYFSTKKDEPASWQAIARAATRLNFFSILGIGACLFYIIYNHFFEYHYAWAHSSTTLPVYYIVSCFWEGQEGSFWLWAFWQGVLANILVFKAKTWEKPVLAVIMLSQAMITSMLLGVNIFGERFGSSPFILLRDAINVKDLAPVFFADPANYAGYLDLVKKLDGEGLNPLLQNYWMVIHPPTLFLGFASMIVPFAYAVAGLWQKRYKEWTQPVMPWALFAVMVLGTGIIMGSFWAYEALNFGGFWGWDPVENASLIPWITLIAAVHVLLAYKHSGHSYFTATFLVLISFVLVLYASFLTRSGILGETSVHAFTDLGMFWHLVADVVLFAGIAIVLLVVRWKELPITNKDEETYSREFWLFIGALVLSVACIQIVAFTSIPVVNAIFHTKLAPPVNPVENYNKWQVPIAVVIALISGFSQFLKYKNTDARKFYSSIGIAALVAVVLTAGALYVTGVYDNPMFIILTFASLFSVFINARILADAIKRKWKLAGSAVAHIGFGLLLLGALVAASTNKVISLNSSGMIPVKDFEKANKPGENIFLTQGEPVQMDKYTVTYLSDTTIYPNTFYKLNFKVLDDKGKVQEDFYLYPNAQQNAKMGLIASPDTRHHLTYDVYTHATAAPPIESPAEKAEHGHDGEEEGYEEPEVFNVNQGDTVRYAGGIVIVREIKRGAVIKDIPLNRGDISVGMQLEVQSKGKSYTAEPIYLLKDGMQPMDFGKTIGGANIKVRFPKIDPDKNSLVLLVYSKKAPDTKYIVIKAIVFPYINLFWAGSIIMVAGFLLSIFRRNKELKVKA